MILNIPQNWLKIGWKEKEFKPPYVPDFNPIGTSLSEESTNINPKNMTELKLVLMQEWNKIESTMLEELVDSVSSRLYECIKMKDWLSN